MKVKEATPEMRPRVPLLERTRELAALELQLLYELAHVRGQPG
jgi:hypothetical protein